MPTKSIALAPMIALAVLASLSSRARAEVIVTFAQSGNDVVATASGSLNLDGVLFIENYQAGGNAYMDPSDVVIDFNPTGGEAAEYYGVTPPGTFGGEIYDDATSTSGDVFIIERNYVIVPAGYSSGSTIFSTDTFENTTMSGLGLTPGTYYYTWGSAATADDVKVIISAAVPEPPTLALTAVMLGFVFGLVTWRDRRRRIDPSAQKHALPWTSQIS